MNMAMTDNFNTYVNRIDSAAWRELCVSKGTLRRYAKGEEFVSAGETGRYIGFIVSGLLTTHLSRLRKGEKNDGKQC